MLNLYVVERYQTISEGVRHKLIDKYESNLGLCEIHSCLSIGPVKKYCGRMYTIYNLKIKPRCISKFPLTSKDIDVTIYVMRTASFELFKRLKGGLPND